MKIEDLSAKAQSTLKKLAQIHGLKPIDVLHHIQKISSCGKVSRHSVLSFAPLGV